MNMELNVYQILAMRTSPDDHDRIRNGCLGLIGESGEIVDIIKKHMFQSVAGTPLPVDKLIEEMGDVMWYLAETATGISLCLETAVGKPDDAYLPDPQYEGKQLDQIAVMLSGCASFCYMYLCDKSTICHDHAVFGRYYLYSAFSHLQQLCLMLGTTMDHVMENNIEKLKKRYPDGFDPERSMNRPEYRNEQTESSPGFLFTERNQTI